MEQHDTSNSKTEKSSIKNENREYSTKELNQLAGIEFKSQSYASFYNTAMEKDKSILTLSVAGIGFLITLLQLTSNITFFDIAFFVLAAISFLAAIFCIISIFDKNSKFIIDLTTGKDVKVKQYQLEQLDKIAIRTFYIGIVMSLLLGISTSSALLHKGDNDEQTKCTATEPRTSILGKFI
ncbi:hypothetical protein [Aeromonas veronii]|uniref:hypothetical protein n=2 Tax=Aeromonas veronii TaxID=654 RepID=UPI001119E1AF|nr:hypothetical protein [Aeromonas veronii]